MELTLNSAVMNVELSGIRQFTYLVRDTPGACALTIGEPDLNTPDAIKEAAKAALDANDTHYPPGNGFPYLLEAVSKFEAEHHGLHYAPNEIIMTVGATEALFAAFSTVLNPGDEVIIPTPAFGLYEALVRLQDGVPVNLPTEHNHFQIVPQELKAAITPKTKAIILTSPNNPTGCMYTKETLDAVHDILKDKPIFVLCDDVYRTLVYTEGYHSFAEYQDMRDRIIIINSFSKPYAMTGWRLGYCMADAPIMDRIQVFHQYAVTSIPSFVQKACVTALGTDTSDVIRFPPQGEHLLRLLRLRHLLHCHGKVRGFFLRRLGGSFCREAEALDELGELQAQKEGVRRRAGVTHQIVLRAELQRCVGGNGGQPIGMAGALLPSGQFLDGGGLCLDVRHLLVEGLDAAILLDEIHGGLLSHTGDAGDIVGGVPHEGLEVDHVDGIEAVLFPEGRRSHVLGSGLAHAG